MNIPTFNDLKFVKENGYLTDEMRNYNDELNTNLRGALSDNGWTLPQQTQAQIEASATAPSTPTTQPAPDGAMWYDTDNDLFVIKINGALRKVTTTAYP